MDEKVFVIIEEKELPKDNLVIIDKKKKRYGYISVLFLINIIFVFAISVALIILKG